MDFQHCGQLLIARGQTVATAESCTGGLLAGCITAVPGISAAFPMGVVTYSNEAKMQLLQVPAQTLHDHGAVSVETAKAMAAGLRELSKADYCLAVTGIAGPDGGSTEKPVGLVYIGLAQLRGTQVREYRFAGDRAAVRTQTCEAAIALLAAALAE